MDALGPLMFVVAFALIFTGFPVAFALGGSALIFAAVGVGAGAFDWALLNAACLVFWYYGQLCTARVSIFIFMGTMLERSNWLKIC